MRTEGLEQKGDHRDVSDPKSRWCCPICKQWDNAENMVPATWSIPRGSWFGKAHVKCIQKYNETHEQKYSIREYTEKGKFLGKSQPI
jgi:hypothetical protein